MPQRCICQICTCGRHKCPHKTRTQNTGETCKLSEYSERYLQHPLSKADSCKPQYVPSSNEPMQDTTTHRMHYVGHDTQRPEGRKQQPYRAPEGEMDLTTDYRQNYNGENASKATSYRPRDAFQSNSKFEGVPTYQRDYQKWDMEPINRKGPDFTWQPPNDPFAGSTNYRSDFDLKDGRPAQKCQPNDSLQGGDRPFDGVTSYSQEYRKHSLQPKDVRQVQTYEPNTQRFDGTSTQRSDYTEKIGRPSKSFKPYGLTTDPNIPFDDSTTSKNDYKPWEVQQRQKREAEVWIKPEGQTDTTSYRNDFMEHAVSRPTIVKPRGEKFSDAPFDGTTNYQQSYYTHDPQKTEKFTPRQDYKPSTTPFDGTSDYRQNFVSHSIDKVTTKKPSAYQSSAPFDDRTMYKSHFTAKEPEQCPALAIEKHDQSYICKFEDDTGHRFYDTGITGAPALSVL